MYGFISVLGQIVDEVADMHVIVPTFIFGDKDKKIAFNTASTFVREIYEKYGFIHELKV